MDIYRQQKRKGGFNSYSTKKLSKQPRKLIWAWSMPASPCYGSWKRTARFHTKTIRSKSVPLWRKSILLGWSVTADSSLPSESAPLQQHYCLPLVLAFPCIGSGFPQNPTPDNQQYLVQGHEISTEMVAEALAEHDTFAQYEGSNLDELETYLGFQPALPQRLTNGLVATRYSIFFLTEIQLSVSYAASSDVPCVLSYNAFYYSDMGNAYLSMEQSETGEYAWNMRLSCLHNQQSLAPACLLANRQCGEYANCQRAVWEYQRNRSWIHRRYKQMNKTLRTVIVSMVLIILFTQSACAIGITPYADSEFSIASASLSSRKTVSFSCITYVEKSCISITKCWLQQKINNSWIKVCDLDAPTNTATNSMSFGVLMDYSSQIDTGTFRVGFTVNADGHAITRYSNSRTF